MAFDTRFRKMSINIEMPFRLVRCLRCCCRPIAGKVTIEVARKVRGQPCGKIAHQSVTGDLRQHPPEAVADRKLDTCCRALLRSARGDSGSRLGWRSGCADRCRFRRSGRTELPASRSMRAAPRKSAEIGPSLTRIAPSTRSGVGMPVNDAPGRQAATCLTSPSMSKTLSGG